ncbi:MAG: hypothetical protein F4011_10855 [Acidimicrobiaceae bacterium]|nr:hypothetical protein [Acidimicrobiaceae bacterium]MYL04663.1 hypothetical protein [Acidimicrobiaceae bacterium]
MAAAHRQPGRGRRLPVPRARPGPRHPVRPEGVFPGGGERAARCFGHEPVRLRHRAALLGRPARNAGA